MSGGGGTAADAEKREIGAERTVAVGIVADPGLPSELARRVERELPEVLARRVNDRVEWQLSTVSEELPLDSEDRVPIVTAAHEKLTEHAWDLLVCVTDQPRREGTRPILADLSMTHGVGLVSLPTVGGIRIPAHLRATLVHLLGVLSTQKLRLDGNAPPERYRIRSRPTEWVSPIRQVPSGHPALEMQLALAGGRGRLRLLWGMVRNNRPWRLVPSLSKALAAAAGTAAFGVFYSSIWGMANALSWGRLCGIAVFAIGVMVSWLIAYNNLWDRPRKQVDREKAVLYNAATVCTLLAGVACMYLVLFAVTLVAALAVISSEYLRAQLGHPVGAGDYLGLVWLASSMGTVAGALGSSLESEHAVTRATYGVRERQRRARNRERERQQSDGGS